MRNPCLSGFPPKDISPILHIREPYDANDLIVNASQREDPLYYVPGGGKTGQYWTQEEFVMIPPFGGVLRQTGEPKPLCSPESAKFEANRR